MMRDRCRLLASIAAVLCCAHQSCADPVANIDAPPPLRAKCEYEETARPGNCSLDIARMLSEGRSSEAVDAIFQRVQSERRRNGKATYLVRRVVQRLGDSGQQVRVSTVEAFRARLFQNITDVNCRSQISVALAHHLLMNDLYEEARKFLSTYSGPKLDSAFFPVTSECLGANLQPALRAALKMDELQGDDYDVWITGVLVASSNPPYVKSAIREQFIDEVVKHRLQPMTPAQALMFIAREARDNGLQATANSIDARAASYVNAPQ